MSREGRGRARTGGPQRAKASAIRRAPARRVVPRRIATPGKLVPPSARHLKARVIRLMPGGAMDWHTTGDREELLFAMAGRVILEVEPQGSSRRRAVRSVAVSSGQCVFLPQQVVHRVVNRSSSTARYVYVTGGVN